MPFDHPLKQRTGQGGWGSRFLREVVARRRPRAAPGQPPAAQVQTAEVHPGSKDVHLRAIAAAIGAPLDKLIFFDDLPHNIRTAESIGVGASILTKQR